MKILSLSILLVLALTLLNAASATNAHPGLTPHSHKDIMQKYKESLKSDVDSAEIHDLLAVYNKVQALKDQGIAVTQAVPADNVCKFLARLNISPLIHTHLIDEFISLRHDFQCSSIEIVKKFEDYFSKISKGSNFNDVEAAITIGLKDKTLVDQKRVAELCNKLPDFLTSDGSTKQSKKGDSATYRDTASLLHVFTLCKTHNLTESKTESEINKQVGELVKAAKYLSEDSLAIPEGDFFTTTARVVGTLLRYNASVIPPVKLGHFANYINEHKDHLATPEKTVAFFYAAAHLKNIPIVHFRTGNLLIGKSMQAKIDLTNIVDEAFAGKVDKVKGTLNSASKQIEEFEFKKDGNSYVANIDGSKVSNPGHYTIGVEVSVGSQYYTKQYKSNVLLQKENTIDAVRFDVFTSKDKVYTPLNNEVKSGKKFDKVLSANQNNYIHIQFSLKSDAPKITFSAARLVNPKYPTATGTVVSTTHKGDNDYYIVIDLGDPDHILPYNDIYDLELIIASENVHNNLIWKFASLNITFVKPATRPPKTDGDFDPLPEIQHMFPAERKKPNSLITLAFTGLVGVASLFFLGMISKIRAHQDAEGRFPSSGFGALISFVFLIAIFGVLSVLFLFWTKINLFETLSILAVSIIPLVFIGNRALASIDKS